MEEKKGFNLKEFLRTGTGRMCFVAVFYIAFFAVFGAVVAISMKTRAVYIVFAFCALFVYFGWKALNRITPSIFLIMPVVGWIFYFTIKFIIAYFVGVVIAPYKIAKKVLNKI